ncbi:uncharacterized protein LY89DRAFT_732558 [Mollisia scopiformis]|uniref:Uncharacterized protein n=1 Tax=Mollisia scopiformis TaxID=149040 RepID=A0A194XCG2_MOLSC|nr:uncharacterized protein LY89DRAFT_732558 [Mollisia scopiformis]KUJ17846.1 hypothetical protein LY89DRAFT_732558 [Mollisia scopiformis]
MIDSSYAQSAALPATSSLPSVSIDVEEGHPSARLNDVANSNERTQNKVESSTGANQVSSVMPKQGGAFGNAENEVDLSTAQAINPKRDGVDGDGASNAGTINTEQALDDSQESLPGDSMDLSSDYEGFGRLGSKEDIA